MQQTVRKHWYVHRLLIEDQVALATMIAVAYMIAIAIITFVVDRLGTVDRSIWASSSVVAAGYGAIMGGYVMHTMLPIHVANGVTRRQFAGQAGVLWVVLSIVLALLVTIGFALERLLYSLMDWPQSIVDDHLFSSAGEYGVIFVEYLLVMLVWMAVGGLLGAAFYRDKDGAGPLAIAPALLSLALLDLRAEVNGIRIGRLLDQVIDISSVPVVVAALSCAAAIVLPSALTWAIVRDMPLRSKTT